MRKTKIKNSKISDLKLQHAKAWRELNLVIKKLHASFKFSKAITAPKVQVIPPEKGISSVSTMTVISLQLLRNKQASTILNAAESLISGFGFRAMKATAAKAAVVRYERKIGSVICDISSNKDGIVVSVQSKVPVIELVTDSSICAVIAQYMTKAIGAGK